MSVRRFEGVAESLDDFGRGIIRHEGRTYFVKDLLPGERALLETDFAYGRLKEVRLIERKTESPHRVAPLCSHYPLCGGCQIMHLSYSEQLRYKREKVQALLHKFAGIDFPVRETLGMSTPSRYRNKVQKPIRLVHGRPEIGFYQEGTHRLIPALDCPAESSLSARISASVLRLIRHFRWPVYDEDRRTGLLRHLLVKTNRKEDEALVTLVVTEEFLPGRKEFARRLMEQVPEVKGVVLNINPRDTNVILGKKDVLVYGYPQVRDAIFGKTFLVSTQSFYQTNSRQIEALYGLAIEFAAASKEDVVLDAYCGTGTIGLSIADRAKAIVGVEIVPDAVRDAVRNARENGIRNARFVTADCTRYLLETKERFDVVVLDPPRKGATREFLLALLAMKPKRIVYVSCDPVTLARDLSLLKKEYQVRDVVPVDMFPHTLHVETVVSLVRNGPEAEGESPEVAHA